VPPARAVVDSISIYRLYAPLMTSGAPRRLRADAARNSERIARAAREVYAERGPGALLDEIAASAGVGIATLYRRFPDKAGLVRAALEQAFTEQLAHVMERALEDDDSYRGLVAVLEAALSMAASERNLLAAAKDVGALTAEASAPFFASLTLLAGRGQATGLIRDDLVADDIVRIMIMLVSVLSTMGPDGDGWRRYLALILDALSPAAARPLPPAVPLVRRGSRRTPSEHAGEAVVPTAEA
jgi:AcrR family transcriptional regulator